MPIRRKDKKGNEILTAKEQEFCLQYSICRNGTESAIKAGYSKNSAKEIASKELTKVNIQKEIERLNGNFEEVAAKMGVTKAKIMAEHLKIANTTIAHLHNTWIERKEFETLTEAQKACIKEIDTKVEYKVFNEEGKKGKRKIEYIKIQLYDKQKALDSISKLMGFNAIEKFDLTSKGEQINISFTPALKSNDKQAD
jgi:phage terminase small subunit